MALSKINSRAITDLTISADDLASGSITNAKIATNAIDSDNYVDGSIDTAHLSNNAVTSDKIDTTVASTGKSIAMSLVFG